MFMANINRINMLNILEGECCEKCVRNVDCLDPGVHFKFFLSTKERIPRRLGDVCVVRTTSLCLKVCWNNKPTKTC